MLADQGANVVVHYNGEKSRTDAEETAALVRATGTNAELISADLTMMDQLHNLLDRTVERFGLLDVLINRHGHDH
jgi:NAD(P)-dependent dehydrogenase (short-subunit alcohol dehydrogenase family)